MLQSDLRGMLTLQDELNRIVNPDWRSAGYNWPRATFVESAELMDHLGWKWWKKPEPNCAQAQIELVDIWHFLLSQTLQLTGGNLSTAAEWIGYQWHKPTIDDVQDTRKQVEQFVVAVLTDGRPQITRFRMLCEALALSPDRLKEMYVGKNVLNIFRQRNGYKEGTYVKFWKGHEDNVVLERLMEATTDPAVLLQKLAEEYAFARTA